MAGMDLSTAALVGVGAIIGLWLIFKLIFKVVPWVIGLVLGLIIAILAAPFVLLKEAIVQKRRRREEAQGGPIPITVHETDGTKRVAYLMPDGTVHRPWQDTITT